MRDAASGKISRRVSLARSRVRRRHLISSFVFELSTFLITRDTNDISPIESCEMRAASGSCKMRYPPVKAWNLVKFFYPAFTLLPMKKQRTTTFVVLANSPRCYDRAKCIVNIVMFCTTVFCANKHCSNCADILLDPSLSLSFLLSSTL